MVAAHAVDSGAGGGGGGTNVEAFARRPVWEAAETEGAGGYVSSYEVRVVGLEIRGAQDVAGEDAGAETGGKALDLVLDAGQHVDDGAVGDVAVSPGGV